MSSKWADESKDYEPDPSKESFYLLASLQLGDPMNKDWMEKKSMQFYNLYADWRGWSSKHREDLRRSGESDMGETMLQYMLWYERDRPDRIRS